jgi:hypothetical protein
MGGLDCEVDVVESVDTAVEAEGAVESAEVVVGAEVSVGASVAVDVEEVSEDVVGAEVVGTDELSDGTSDADVDAPLKNRAFEQVRVVVGIIATAAESAVRDLDADRYRM